MRLTCMAPRAGTGNGDQGPGRKLPKRQGPGNRTTRGDAEQHLAVRRGGRVLLGAAKDNKQRREPGTGNRGGIRITSMTAWRRQRTTLLATFSRPPRRTRVVGRGRRQQQGGNREPNGQWPQRREPATGNGRGRGLSSRPVRGNCTATGFNSRLYPHVRRDDEAASAAFAPRSGV